MSNDFVLTATKMAWIVTRKYNISVEMRQEIVEDAPGTVYLAFIKNKKPVLNFPAWSATIIENNLKDRLSKEKDNKLLPNGDVPIEIPYHSQSAYDIATTVSTIASKGIGNRGPSLSHYEVGKVLVYILAGYNTHEIADMLGRNEKSIYNTIKRIRDNYTVD